MGDNVHEGEGLAQSHFGQKILFRNYSRLTFSVAKIIAQQDCACALWTNYGEERTGKSYRNSGITFLQFKEGKIMFLSDYFKDTSFTI